MFFLLDAPGFPSFVVSFLFRECPLTLPLGWVWGDIIFVFFYLKIVPSLKKDFFFFSGYRIWVDILSF